MSDADRQRRLNRERQRRWRQRQHPHRCEMVVPVTVCQALVNYLAVLEWLDERDGGDAKKIGAAIAAGLKKSLTRY
jgi:hypothetical protein